MDVNIEINYFYKVQDLIGLLMRRHGLKKVELKKDKFKFVACIIPMQTKQGYMVSIWDDTGNKSVTSKNYVNYLSVLKKIVLYLCKIGCTV